MNKGFCGLLCHSDKITITSMRKNIKYSASSIIIILSLMLSYVVYAEDTNVPNTSGTSTTKLEQMLQSVRVKREEFKTELDASKEQAKLKIAEMRANFTESLKNIKDE